jgi:hypothetical protein
MRGLPRSRPAPEVFRDVLLPTVLDVIGDTPVVDVSVLAPHPGVRLLAKLEGQNPHEPAHVAFDHLHRPEALT